MDHMKHHDESPLVINWSLEHKPVEPPHALADSNMSRVFWRQVDFMQHEAPRAFFSNPLEIAQHSPRVVSTHMVGNWQFPVYSLSLESLTMVIKLKCDLVSWVISVKSLHPITADFGHLFFPDQLLAPTKFLGFSPEWILQPYGTNPKAFSLQLGNEFQVFTFLFMLGQNRSQIVA